MLLQQKSHAEGSHFYLLCCKAGKSILYLQYQMWSSHIIYVYVCAPKWSKLFMEASHHMNDWHDEQFEQAGDFRKVSASWMTANNWTRHKTWELNRSTRKPWIASLPPKMGGEGWSVKIIEPSKSQAGGRGKKKKPAKYDCISCRAEYQLPWTII